MTNCSYGGTNRIMREQFAPLGIECDFVDFSDMAAVEAAVKPNTKLIFSESPTNPTLQVPDSSLLHPLNPPVLAFVFLVANCVNSAEWFGYRISVCYKNCSLYLPLSALLGFSGLRKSGD